MRDESKSVQYLKMAAENGVSAFLDASRVLSVGLSQSVCIRKQGIFYIYSCVSLEICTEVKLLGFV